MASPTDTATAIAELEAARASTMRFVDALDDATLTAWPDSEFSPLCWHLGHLAYTEALWLLQRVAGERDLTIPYAQRFAQGACPKSERAQGYDREQLWSYLTTVRQRIRERYPTLDRSNPLMRGDYLVRFLAQHENQHRETMAYVLGCVREANTGSRDESEGIASSLSVAPPSIAPVGYAGGPTLMGTDDPLAYDNERPRHTVTVAPFLLDATALTAAHFAQFIADAGYLRRDLWSAEGWAWRQRLKQLTPKGWRRMGDRWTRTRLDGSSALHPDEPVCGISWFEAEAAARYFGGRLPTEQEWEHAARRDSIDKPRIAGLRSWGPEPVMAGTERPTDLLGNVWEWTASAFAPWPGFEPYPYRGYSMPYFDGVHRVLRGGSFATDPAIARVTFRNWYAPQTRQVFAGVRLARDGAA